MGITQTVLRRARVISIAVPGCWICDCFHGSLVGDLLIFGNWLMALLMRLPAVFDLRPHDLCSALKSPPMTRFEVECFMKAFTNHVAGLLRAVEPPISRRYTDEKVVSPLEAGWAILMEVTLHSGLEVV